MGLKIQLLGRPAIFDADGAQQTVRGLQAWALLARILLSQRELGRRELASELFPDTVDPLGSLRWCLASLRRAVGSAQAFTGDPINSNLPTDTEVDILQLAAGDPGTIVAGNLLDGLEPRCSPEFATWLLIERERTAGIIDAKLRQEVMQAVAVGQYERAIELAEQAVRRLPYNESAQILLVKSLTLAGRGDAALDHVEATEKAFISELGVEPSAALRSAARRTIEAPPAGVPARAVVRSLIDSGLAALAAGAVDAGVDCLRRAAADAEKCADRQLHARALLELGTALVHSVRGYDDEGAIVLRQSSVLAQQCADPQLASAGFRELGYLEALAGRRLAAAGYLANALEISDDADSLAGTYGVMGFNLVDWGKTEEGLEHYNLSLEYARGAQNRRREAWSLGVGAWGQLAADRLQSAQHWLTDCLAIIEDLRWVAFRPWPLAVQAEVQLRLQSEPQSLRVGLEEAFALSCQLGDPCWEGATARMLALTYAANDDFSTAFEWIDQARKKCVRESDTYVALLAAILASCAQISLRINQPEQADSFARELLSLAARAHMDNHLQWAVAFIGGIEQGLPPAAQ